MRFFSTLRQFKVRKKRLRYPWHRLLLLLLIGILIVSGCHTIRSGVKTQKVTHITFWHGVNPPPNRDVLQKLVDKFNQTHPHIYVESLYVGQQDQQMPKILAAVVGNAPPDLLWFNPTITGQLVELGALIPVDEMLSKSPIKEQIDPTLYSSMAYQGQLWSVPFATNNVGIFYRPSLFQAAGIKIIPRTWEEFRQVAQKLTRDVNGDGQIDQYGMFLPLGKGEFTVFTWLPFMWSSGGELVNGDAQNAAGVVLQDNQGAIAALQFWRNLVQDGSTMLSSPERGYEIEPLISGRVAMQINGPWNLGQLQATNVDFGVFPLPVNQSPATSIGGENLFFFKTTPERQKAAFKFAEYTMSEGFQTELALAAGYLPINLKSRTSTKYQAFVQKLPQVKVFLEQAKNGRSRPIFPGYNRISDSIGKAVEAVLLGESSPQAALQASQRRLNLIFK